MQNDRFLPSSGRLRSRGLIATAEMIVGWVIVRIVHYFCLSGWGRGLDVGWLLWRRFLFVVFEILIIIFKLFVFVSIIVVLSVK